MACGGCILDTLNPDYDESDDEDYDDETVSQTDMTNQDGNTVNGERGGGNASLATTAGGDASTFDGQPPPLVIKNSHQPTTKHSNKKDRSHNNISNNNNTNKKKMDNTIMKNKNGHGTKKNSKGNKGGGGGSASDSSTKRSAGTMTNDNQSGTNNSGAHSSGGTVETILNMSYDNATPLFRNIEKENWTGVLTFLNTGKWNTSMFTSSFDHMKSPSQQIQARTWVTFYDKKTGEPEWSQLPLHAAISYNAPHVVIQKLVEIFPKAVQCTDRESMLPIHLAFGFGCSDAIIALLLETFPASLDERGVGNRYPYECCDLGPNKIRGKVFTIIAKQTTLRAQDEYDTEWKTFTKAAMNRLNLKSLDPPPPLNSILPDTGANEEEDLDEMIKNKSLSEFLLELLEDRKELYYLKQKLTERLTQSSSSTPMKKNEKASLGMNVSSIFTCTSNKQNGGNNKQSKSNHDVGSVLPGNLSLTSSLQQQQPMKTKNKGSSYQLTAASATSTTAVANGTTKLGGGGNVSTTNTVKRNVSTTAVKGNNNKQPHQLRSSPLVAGGTSNKNRNKTKSQ